MHFPGASQMANNHFAFSAPGTCPGNAFPNRALPPSLHRATLESLNQRPKGLRVSARPMGGACFISLNRFLSEFPGLGSGGCRPEGDARFVKGTTRTIA